MAVPNIFGTATAAIPLSQLDSNFATTITLGNTAIQLGNTVTTLNNMTLANVTISSGTSSITSNSISNGTSNVSIATSGGAVTIATNGNTAVTVDTSQRVGIGTSSPDTILNIQGVDPTFLIQDSDEAGDGFIKFQTANGTQRAFIQAAMTANVMLLGVGTSEAMRIDSSGNVLVGTSSATANGGILQLSSGITFPATQVAATNANTLDDYEEGTFTPTVEGTTTAGTTTYSSQQGTYLKIGKYVHLQIFIVLAAAHTGTGGTKIGGFPFTSGSTFGAGGSVVYKTAFVTNGADFMQTEASTTFGYLRYSTGASQGDINPSVNMQDTTGFMLNISYIANA